MTSRVELLSTFVRQGGWDAAIRQTVAGDASNRRYDRLTKADGSTTILMDAPPDKGEDVRPFVEIAKYLRSVGLSAPEIYHSDPELGFLLLEDLGDDLFARVLEKTPLLETDLYENATDVLTLLHQSEAPNLESYNIGIMTDMACLAFDFYQMGSVGQNDGESEFRDCFFPLLKTLENAPSVLIQRDYHAENLLWLPDRTGVRRVGLLDFQDAMLGHPAYDLVSVLQDARRDVPQEVEAAMIARFIAQNPHVRDGFETAYATLGLQRNLRILGVFARLCMRDGKAHYVDLIPRVWGHIETNLRHPALSTIADVIHRTLPFPTQTVLNTLKSKCATLPKP